MVFTMAWNHFQLMNRCAKAVEFTVTITTPDYLERLQKKKEEKRITNYHNRQVCILNLQVSIQIVNEKSTNSTENTTDLLFFLNRFVFVLRLISGSRFFFLSPSQWVGIP